jgi:hypothetical protein
MDVISVKSIDDRILCDYKAIIQSLDNSITVLPRSAIPFKGTHVSVTHLRATAFPSVIEAILVPYSVHTISGCEVSQTMKLQYLVFEFESELRSILNLPFTHSGLTSLFFPTSIRFIGPIFRYDCPHLRCLSLQGIDQMDISAI